MSHEHTLTIFDEQASRYDAWYETPGGAVIFAAELDALRPLLAELPRPWLEVGVGSGRFAAALGVEVGVDPAQGALVLAADRGIRVVEALGEALPFRDETFGAVLLIVTLCFVSDPRQVLRDARRVLRPDGGVVLGLIYADSPWGQHYQSLAAQGHPYYKGAQFYTRRELASLFAATGFSAVRARSALFCPPNVQPVASGVREGDRPEAGFVALLASGHSSGHL
jgi:SAM-dependent methyltransferase